MSKHSVSAIIFLAVVLTAGSVVRSQRSLPNPVLAFTGPTVYEAQGVKWTRYHYYVRNADDYPSDLFAPAPDLPPCGLNKNSSRSWIDLYEQNGKRLYGFCAIKDATGLADIYFNLESDKIPPSWIYIEITDRKTSTKYKSNLAETIL